MPVAVAPQTEIPLPPWSTAVYPPRKRWTRAECQGLESTGLWDRDRFELIDGELISKVPKKRPHSIVFVAVLKWLSGFVDQLFLNLESPLDVAPGDNPSSEPEPDIAVLAREATEFQSVYPSASDVRLLIEISDSTLAFDLGPKARLYARAGVADFWVFDVRARRIIVHREPKLGGYANVTAYAEGESVAPLAKPEVVLQVTAAFPLLRA